MPGSISALNELSRPVDWWFVYKVPKMAAEGDSPEATGYEHFYYDPGIDKLIQSHDLLTGGKCALDTTIDTVFDSKSKTTGWILYNDEMPDDSGQKDAGRYGHTKGVIAFDTKTGSAIWLLHSWPKFPCPHTEGLPTPKYGQTFLCLSIDLDTAGKIAQQMINHQQPQVYSPNIPDSLPKDHPLHQIVKGVDPNADADTSVLSCSTRGGMKFKVIAKNRNWGRDFWIDLVGPTLGSDMDVETWIRGKIPPMMDSDGIHETYDVKFIDFHPLGYPYSWPETHDHAKWGIAVDSDWICVGDMNRMISQEKRGGGTIAFQNKTLWKALKQTDLLVPPKGLTVEDVKKHIRAAHAHMRRRILGHPDT